MGSHTFGSWWRTHRGSEPHTGREGYRRQGDSEGELRSLAHPSLGWPSAVEARTDATVAAVTVYAGSGRPIDFGRFIRSRRTADAGSNATRKTASCIAPPGIRTRPGIQSLVFTTSLISDDRDKLPPSQWIIRLPVGADDGDAYRCDVHLAWSESRPSAQSVVDEALERLAIVSI
mgnify:CR=1 FL=1